VLNLFCLYLREHVPDIAAVALIVLHVLVYIFCNVLQRVGNALAAKALQEGDMYLQTLQLQEPSPLPSSVGVSSGSSASSASIASSGSTGNGNSGDKGWSTGRF
jgi:uncharacterized membrane protein YgcG